MSRLFNRYGFTINEGDYLFKEGDTADSLYMIESGTIKISRIVQNVEEILQTLTDGEFVGEMAVIDSMPRSADAIALVDSKLIRMDRYAFEEIIVKNSQFAASFIKFLSKRIRNTNEMMKAVSEKRIEDRFYIQLLKECMKNGKKDKSKKMQLVHLQDFLEKYTKVYNGNADKFWTTINAMVESGKLSLVKDQNKVQWLSLKI